MRASPVENKRAQKYALEAQADRETLVRRAAERWSDGHRWPRRRFRVEGSPAGNSRLMTDLKARATIIRYGGTVVEVIPVFEKAKVWWQGTEGGKRYLEMQKQARKEYRDRKKIEKLAGPIVDAEPSDA